MSISPIASLLSGSTTPATAAVTKGAELHSQISQYSIKDEIKLSKEAVSLLLSAAQNTVAK